MAKLGKVPAGEVQQAGRQTRHSRARRLGYPVTASSAVRPLFA
jgi:hypothetical protein